VADQSTRRAGGVFVALGSNLGDRAGNLNAALRALDELPGTRVLRSSRFHETESVGGPPGQPDYLNAVAELQTALPPGRLLEELLKIETAQGRVRHGASMPRTLDLDLLLYHDERIEEPGLTVPHPRMWERDFVLRPLGELCDVAALQRRFARGGPDSPDA
jgi:2-amino-4-hydroxy-6-hydroxymethyldihydropteridine diphosphokinase